MCSNKLPLHSPLFSYWTRLDNKYYGEATGNLDTEGGENEGYSITISYRSARKKG